MFFTPDLEFINFFRLYLLIYHLANIPSKFKLVLSSASEVISKRKLEKKYKPRCIFVMNRDRLI